MGLHHISPISLYPLPSIFTHSHQSIPLNLLSLTSTHPFISLHPASLYTALQPSSVCTLLICTHPYTLSSVCSSPRKCAHSLSQSACTPRQSVCLLIYTHPSSVCAPFISLRPPPSTLISLHTCEVDLGTCAVVIPRDLPNLVIVGQSSVDVLANEFKLVQRDGPQLRFGDFAARACQKIGE